MISLKKQLQHHGVIKVEKVFSKDEITQIRKNLQEHFETQWEESDCGKAQSNAAVNCGFLEAVLTHPNMVSTMKAVADGAPMFTGNADIHQNRSSNWHKDSVFFDRDPFGENYKPLYKVAIYLGDQHTDARGLQYREGSHFFDNSVDGQHRVMTSSEGDVVIFDLRITHSGMLPSLVERVIWRINQLLSTGKKSSTFGRRVKSLIWKANQVKDRDSIFFVFGSDNDSTEEFARNIVKAQGYGSKAKISHQLSRSLHNNGVKVCHSIKPV